jgi:hypothetical protein
MLFLSITLICNPNRDRVVHALALKSYSKSSLSARLSREKSQDNDFDQLDAILQEVATLQNGGLYVLKKSLFAQINADSWPLYGDAEKRIVRCNIASARSRSPDVTKKVKQENYVCVVTVIKLHMYDLLLSLEIIPSW